MHFSDSLQISVCIFMSFYQIYRQLTSVWILTQLTHISLNINAILSHTLLRQLTNISQNIHVIYQMHSLDSLKIYKSEYYCHLSHTHTHTQTQTHTHTHTHSLQLGSKHSQCQISVWKLMPSSETQLKQLILIILNIDAIFSHTQLRQLILISLNINAIWSHTQLRQLKSMSLNINATWSHTKLRQLTNISLNINPHNNNNNSQNNWWILP